MNCRLDHDKGFILGASTVPLPQLIPIPLVGKHLLLHQPCSTHVLDNGGQRDLSQLQILVNTMHGLSFDERTGGSGNTTMCNSTLILHEVRPEFLLSMPLADPILIFAIRRCWDGNERSQDPYRVRAGSR
jgi:hypothetical protein